MGKPYMFIPAGCLRTCPEGKSQRIETMPQRTVALHLNLYLGIKGGEVRGGVGYVKSEGGGSRRREKGTLGKWSNAR